MWLKTDFAYDEVLNNKSNYSKLISEGKISFIKGNDTLNKSKATVSKL